MNVADQVHRCATLYGDAIALRCAEATRTFAELEERSNRLANALLGRGLRGHLVESIRAEARRKNGADPAWIVGEVRSGSPWLQTLVSAGKVIPFDFPYFHPWMQRRAEGRYVLYREPLADTRVELPAQDVVRLVYAIWRRAYRIRFPLQSETFGYMIDRLESAGTIGAHPDFTIG